MKNEIVEILDFEEEKPKVGRPKLASKETKKKSLIIAGISFVFVVVLMTVGYVTLFGFNSDRLLGRITNKKYIKENIKIEEINSLVKSITIKENTIRKIYLTIKPANASNKNIEYKSLNDKIATVDKNGKITGVKKGKTKVIAVTTDGSNLKEVFDIVVINNASGKCEFTSLTKVNNGINYDINCSNAKVKEIQYKIDDGYKILLSKKTNGFLELSKEDLEKDITFKVVYYPNNSKISKYSLETINNTKTTKKITGSCNLDITNVNANSAKYNIDCNNATVTKIAYKIGNGSYIGIDEANLADTILYEESDVTRVIYLNIEYQVDKTNKKGTVTKSSIIEKGVTQVAPTE